MSEFTSVNLKAGRSYANGTGRETFHPCFANRLRALGKVKAALLKSGCTRNITWSGIEDSAVTMYFGFHADQSIFLRWADVLALIACVDSHKTRDSDEAGGSEDDALGSLIWTIRMQLSGCVDKVAPDWFYWSGSLPRRQGVRFAARLRMIQNLAHYIVQYGYYLNAEGLDNERVHFSLDGVTNSCHYFSWESIADARHRVEALHAMLRLLGVDENGLNIDALEPCSADRCVTEEHPAMRSERPTP